MNRRKFLQLFGIGAAAGVAASVPFSEPKAAPDPSPEVPDEPTFEEAVDDFLWGEWNWRERGYKMPIMEKMFAREDGALYKARRDFVSGTNSLSFRDSNGGWTLLPYNVAWVSLADIEKRMNEKSEPGWFIS